MQFLRLSAIVSIRSQTIKLCVARPAETAGVQLRKGMKMNNILTVLESLDFLTTLWLFLLAFVLHEFEEWHITEFERRNFVGLPPSATERSARMWIAFICTVGLVWCAAATLPGIPSLAAWVFLPAIAVALQNALQHAFWSVYFRQYAPGVITAVVLLIPIGGYVAAWAVRQGYVPAWYAAALAGLVAVGLVHTVRAGNRMSPFIRAIYNLGFRLSEMLPRGV
jgi:hypothetical protein